MKIMVVYKNCYRYPSTPVFQKQVKDIIASIDTATKEANDAYEVERGGGGDGEWAEVFKGLRLVGVCRAF